MYSYGFKLGNTLFFWAGVGNMIYQACHFLLFAGNVSLPMFK